MESMPKNQYQAQGSWAVTMESERCNFILRRARMGQEGVSRLELAVLKLVKVWARAIEAVKRCGIILEFVPSRTFHMTSRKIIFSYS